ncbi:hypothetical protein F5884DRAFT_510772 [Xylogone sp. PMI_703]|nr:hypothetical protein F5884DRAFT_510772 [Xylogone sp. PMI_703]
MATDTSPEPSTFRSVRFCTICGKPFTSSPTLKRHLSYCRRNRSHLKSRPRSCHQCAQAKLKCSFQPRCSRCVAKDLVCVYEHSPHPGLDVEALLNGVVDIEAPMQNEHRPVASNELQSEGIMLDSQDVWVPAQVQASELGDALIAESDVFDLIYSPSADIFDSLYVAADNARPTSRSERFTRVIAFLQPRRMSDPLAQHSARLVMQALRAFPTQMLSRENFPPFIHPLWTSQNLPEPLAACMRISQMFVSRTPDIESFLWRTIENEQRRFLEEVQRFSEHDLLAAMQAHLIFIIICLVGECKKSAEWNRNMLVTWETLCWRLEEVRHEPICTVEKSQPSQTWEDWIFAESRRRTACVWFLMSRIVGVKSGNHYCVIADDFHLLPLPSPKVRWEARNQETWHRVSEVSRLDMSTVGDLIDVHRTTGDSSNRERLDYWNARADNLGLLLNIAVVIA